MAFMSYQSPEAVNRDVIISPSGWIACRTNMDRLYPTIQARSWSFRGGVRFEIENLRPKHKYFKTRFISRLELKKAL